MARIPCPGINQEHEFAYAGMAELARQLALSMNNPVWATVNTFNRIGRRPDKRSAIRQPSLQVGAAYRSGKAAVPDGACGLSGLRNPHHVGRVSTRQRPGVTNGRLKPALQEVSHG